MKWLFIILFLLLPFLSYSQHENPYQNEVGLNFTYNGSDGLGASFRFNRQIWDHGIGKIEFNSNLRYVYFARIGYEPIQLRWKTLELGIGLDLKYEYNDFSKFGLSTQSNLAIEVPLEFRFPITEEYSIYCGMSFSQLLAEWTFFIATKNNFISEVRLGFGHKF